MTELESYAARHGVTSIAWEDFVDEKTAWARKREVDRLVDERYNGGPGNPEDEDFSLVTYKYSDGSTLFYDPSGKHGSFYIRRQLDGTPYFQGSPWVTEQVGGRANIDGIWKHFMQDWDYTRD